MSRKELERNIFDVQCLTESMKSDNDNIGGLDDDDDSTFRLISNDESCIVPIKTFKINPKAALFPNLVASILNSMENNVCSWNTIRKLIILDIEINSIDEKISKHFGMNNKILSHDIKEKKQRKYKSRNAYKTMKNNKKYPIKRYKYNQW